MIRTLLAVSALVAGMTGIAVSPAGAARAECQVRNLTTHVNYSDRLQSAIDAAADGDTIRIKGMCAGSFAVPGAGSVTSLTLVGQPGSKTRSGLNGDGSAHVLSVDFVTSVVQVTISNLKITGGGQFGIFSFGNVTLDGRSSVTGNAGGGVFTAGTFIMNDHSAVSGNRGTGIEDEGGVILNDSASVRGNTGQTGGGIFDDDNVLILNDRSLVTGNTAEYGGGIYEVGHLTLDGRASVTGNTATIAGGGILALGGVNACPTWTGAISPNAPDDPPAVIPVAC